MSKEAEEIKAISEFRQLDGNTPDLVGEYFKKIYDKLGKPEVIYEVKDFINSDTRLSNLVINNRVKAFVIETRTAFNHLEFIFGEVDNNALSSFKSRKIAELEEEIKNFNNSTYYSGQITGLQKAIEILKQP